MFERLKSLTEQMKTIGAGQIEGAIPKTLPNPNLSYSNYLVVT